MPEFQFPLGKGGGGVATAVASRQQSLRRPGVVLQIGEKRNRG